jgi:hypothetical protein
MQGIRSWKGRAFVKVYSFLKLPQRKKARDEIKKTEFRAPPKGNEKEKNNKEK